MLFLVLINILPMCLAETATDSVPLYSDCRFWVDPATHMRHLRQQMASFREIFANSMNNNRFISSERARNEPQSVVLVEHQDRAVHCLQDLLSAGVGNRDKEYLQKCITIMFSFYKTAVPCHFLTDTVCIHEDEMSQFVSERQGYYTAHADYHDNAAGDTSDQEAVVVYNSDSEDRDAERPDIFGKKQYHRVSHSSDSLTSQIVKKRLNETGQLNKLEKVHSLQSLGSGSSDYGKPTFYSRGGEVTSNEARDARPVMEVAKVFLGDRLSGSWTSGDKQSRYSNFHNIKKILQGSNSINQKPDNELEAFTMESDYKDISFVSPAHYPRERGTTRGAATMRHRDNDWSTGGWVTTLRDTESVLTPVYGFGIQHLETETSLVTPSGPGDEAIRDIVHLLEETGWVGIIFYIYEFIKGFRECSLPLPQYTLSI